MKTKLPIKDTRKTILITARAPEDDVNKLRAANVNISAVIREAIKDAARRVG